MEVKLAAVVPDSLGRVVAEQKRLIDILSEKVANLAHSTDSLLAAVPDTVRDTLWAGMINQRVHGSGIGVKEVIGWAVTAAGIIAAAFVAQAGWQRAATTGQQLQNQRHETEERRLREQLVIRIRGALETMAVTARSTLKKDKTHPINPETMNGILVSWRRYDRVSDNLWLLGDTTLQDQIETVIDFGRMTAEKIMEDETRFRETRDKLGEVTPKGLRVHPDVINSQFQQRSKLLGLVERLGREAQPLLERFNVAWPPATGHSERPEPETGGDEMPPVIPDFRTDPKGH